MQTLSRPWLTIALFLALGSPATAQDRTPPAPMGTAQPTPVAPTTPAATVNGQPILESAVQRALDRIPPEKHAEARPEIVGFLVDNLLIDQYTQAQKVAIDRKEVESRVDQIRGDIKKQGETFETVLQKLKLTEAEIRTQIEADLRWEKFAQIQATDAALRDMFTKNPDMFDGTLVRARHVLLQPGTDPKGAEQCRAQLLLLRKQVEETAAKGLAKLPPDADKLAREQARIKLIEDAFAAVASEKSACPSKAQGGDVGWFPRAGSMVEPFARAAFALKPYEMSDVVSTQFGQHLILLTERRAGKETKFDDVKEEVKEVYCERLRQDLCGQLKQRSQIVVSPMPRK